MNGSSGPGVWREVFQEGSGRPYYHNTQTNTTGWVKPDELLTPAQLATGWTQTTADDGRVYWYNKTNTSQTSWDPPAGWNAPAPQSSSSGQYGSSDFNYQQRDSGSRELIHRDQAGGLAGRDDFRRERGGNDLNGGYRGPIAVFNSGFENATAAEKEAAFGKLMKRVGAQQDWIYTDAIKAAGSDPAFRAIADPTVRKDAFDDYIADLKRQEAQREQDRHTKLKADFRAMLSRHPEVKRYSTWNTIKPVIEHETVFRSSKSDDEREAIFKEYVAELEEKWQEKRVKDHEAAMEELKNLLKDVKIGPDTHWADAQKMLEDSTAFNDEKYDTLTRSEVLSSFISHVRGLWDQVNTVKQRNKKLEKRDARKQRDAFRRLLKELHSKDVLLANTTWAAVLPHVSSDPRYEALLSNIRSGDPRDDGSSPYDLFLDFVDSLNMELRHHALHAQKLLKAARIKLDANISLDDLASATRKDREFSFLSEAKLKLVHERILQQISSSTEEGASSERRHETRRLIDNLRSRIKHLEPMVTLDDTWESVRPRIERYEEYTALTNPDDRRAAFDKHISRLREYESERERDRRHRDRYQPSSRRDKGRDRSRSPQRRGSATSASIAGDREREREREHNAYAEDRRRATEQREGKYRHASHGSPGGLSPPGRGSRSDYASSTRKPGGGSLDDPPPPPRRDRDRDRRRNSPPPRERTGSYISRADPYSRSSDLLDYGDEPGGGNISQQSQSNGQQRGKRAGSEGQQQQPGNAKKAKVEAAQEEKALQSGSEEGEIEEV